jgi:putative tryptophan/tyrosine transport system substrate-binding protein
MMPGMPIQDLMSRRGFVALAATVSLSPAFLRAQASGARRTVAYIDIDTEGARAAFGRWLALLKERSVLERHRIDVVFLPVDQTDAKSLASLPERLVQLSPWIAVATSLPTVEAVRALQLPGLFYSPADAVTLTWVQSFERPGGRMTGYSGRLASLDKMVEVLSEALPARRQVGVLLDRLYARHVRTDEVIAWARGRGITLTLEHADTLEEFEDFQARRLRRYDAMVVPYTAVPFRHAEQVVAALDKGRIPAIHGSQRLAKLGGILALEADISDIPQVFARQLEAVASGTPPGDIPVERPRRYPLTVNLTAARAMGIQLSASLVKRADFVL